MHAVRKGCDERELILRGPDLAQAHRIDEQSGADTIGWNISSHQQRYAKENKRFRMHIDLKWQHLRVGSSAKHRPRARQSISSFVVPVMFSRHEASVTIVAHPFAVPAVIIRAVSVLASFAMPGGCSWLRSLEDYTITTTLYKMSSALLRFSVRFRLCTWSSDFSCILEVSLFHLFRINTNAHLPALMSLGHPLQSLLGQTLPEHAL